MAVPVLIPDHDHDDRGDGRHADLADEVAALRRALLPLVPAAAAVCGADAPLFRLLCRAVFAPADDPAATKRALRLARFALDQASPSVRQRLAAWPHAACCPAGGPHAHQATASAQRPPAPPPSRPTLAFAAAAAQGPARRFDRRTVRPRPRRPSPRLNRA